MSNPLFSSTVQIERMTSPEVEKACTDAQGVAIIPIGAMEVHGPHLPIGTDSIETYEIGLRAAREVGVVIAPVLWFGNSRSFMDFPGSVSLEPEVIQYMIRDIAHSLIHHGFNKLVILDGHGGNYGILDLLVEEIHLETGVLICHVRAWELATIPKPEGVPPYDGHGGSSETSVMLALCPQDVDQDAYVDSSPDLELTAWGAIFPSPSGLYSQGSVVFPLSMSEMVEHGHHGDPSFASAERGHQLLDVKVNALIVFLRQIKEGNVKWRRRNMSS